MGVFSGPDVSESGLVLALDARNNKSHSSNRFISYGNGLTTQGVGFQVNGDGTFQRIAAGTVIGGYAIKTTDVVYGYALGSNGCHYHGSTASIPTGSHVTMSVDYLVTGATNYPVNGVILVFENYGGGALSGTASVPNSIQNIWQRVTLTLGPTGSTGTQAMFLYPGYCGTRLADSGTIYFRNPKVEFTNVDTGDGNFSSMPNLTTWYNVSGSTNNGTLVNGPQYFNDGYLNFDGTDDFINCGTFFNYTNFTISLWVYPGSTQTTYADIFDNNHTGTQNFVCQQNIDNTNQYSFACINATNASGTSVFTLAANTWQYLTFTWNNSVASAYINGVFHSSGAPANPINYVSPNLNIARWNSGGRNWNGRISNFTVHNRVLTLSEIQQNFNALRGRFGI